MMKGKILIYKYMEEIERRKMKI